MTTKVKLEKKLGFKSGKVGDKDWNSLEVLVSYQPYNKQIEVILSFSGKSDIDRVSNYEIGTIFNTEMIPKTKMYESGKFFTQVFGWGSFTDQNIENYNDIRSKEVDNEWATP